MITTLGDTNIMSAGTSAGQNVTVQQGVQNVTTGVSVGATFGPYGAIIGGAAGLLVTGGQEISDLFNNPDDAKKAIEGKIDTITKQNGGNNDPGVLPKVPIYQSKIFYISVGTLIGLGILGISYRQYQKKRSAHRRVA